jgi:hypothetical protein
MRQVVARPDSENSFDRSLRIRIDEQNPPAFINQVTGQSNHGSGLPYPTALIGNEKANHRDRLSMTALRTISTSLVVHLRYEVKGWRSGSEILPSLSQL